MQYMRKIFHNRGDWESFRINTEHQPNQKDERKKEKEKREKADSPYKWNLLK